MLAGVATVPIKSLFIYLLHYQLSARKFCKNDLANITNKSSLPFTSSNIAFILGLHLRILISWILHLRIRIWLLWNVFEFTVISTLKSFFATWLFSRVVQINDVANFAKDCIEEHGITFSRLTLSICLCTCTQEPIQKLSRISMKYKSQLCPTTAIRTPKHVYNVSYEALDHKLNTRVFWYPTTFNIVWPLCCSVTLHYHQLKLEVNRVARMADNGSFWTLMLFIVLFLPQ